MKIKIILIVVIFVGIFAATSFAQITLPHYKNVSYKCGEKLTFRVHYGMIDAGECSLEIMPAYEKIGPRDCYHIVGIGKSLGAFNMFFKVIDRYETVIDDEALTPWLFIRRVNEGGYKINQNYSFNPYKHTVNTGKETVVVPDSIQDLLSAFYFARTFDFKNIKEGDFFEVKIYLDEKLYPMGIKFLGRETVATKLGKFQCLKFSPQLERGRIFKEQEGMTLWISDYLNHIPIRLESDLLIGSIKIDLSDYSGLSNILNRVSE
jgi:hypothetical protein